MTTKNDERQDGRAELVRRCKRHESPDRDCRRCQLGDEHTLKLYTWSEYPADGSEPLAVVSAVCGCGGIEEEREPRGASWDGAYDEAERRMTDIYAAHLAKQGAMEAAGNFIDRVTRRSGKSIAELQYGPSAGWELCWMPFERPIEAYGDDGESCVGRQCAEPFIDTVSAA